MFETTTILAETAVVGSSLYATGKSSIVKAEGQEGVEDGYYVNKKKAAVSTTACSVGTSLTYGIQEASFNNTLNQVNAAQSYVESMSNEELEQALVALGELDKEGILEEVTKSK